RTEAQNAETAAAVEQARALVTREGGASASNGLGDRLEQIRSTLAATPDLNSMDEEQRSGLRAQILDAEDRLIAFQESQGTALSPGDQQTIKNAISQLRSVTDYVLTWVIVAVALALGIGTTVGWKRIVVTVGEKIGKTHLTYAQGASAELVAMTTIAG